MATRAILYISERRESVENPDIVCLKLRDEKVSARFVELAVAADSDIAKLPLNSGIELVLREFKKV